jgi:hypothetical protein
MNRNSIAILASLVLSSSAWAGTFNSRCEYIAPGLTGVTCEDVQQAAAKEVTDAFIAKYPSSDYSILFSVHSGNVGKSEQFAVIANLYKMDPKKNEIIFSPPLAGFSVGGNDSRNPTVSLQKENLLSNVRKAVQALVSWGTGR